MFPKPWAIRLETAVKKVVQSVLWAPGARVKTGALVRGEDAPRPMQPAVVKVMAWMYWGQVDVARVVPAKAARRVICGRVSCAVYG